jgi:hypothetical protein
MKQLQKQLEREAAKRKEAELRALAAESRAPWLSSKESKRLRLRKKQKKLRLRPRLLPTEGPADLLSTRTIPPKKSVKKSKQDDGRNSPSRKKARHSSGTVAGVDAECDGSDDGAFTELPEESPVRRRRSELAECQSSQQTPK